MKHQITKGEWAVRAVDQGRRAGEADPVQRRRHERRQGSLLPQLLSHQHRRHRPDAADDRRRQSQRRLLGGRHALRRHLVAPRPAAGVGAPQDRRRQPGAAAREPATSPSCKRRAGRRRRSFVAKGRDGTHRHLGRHLPAVHVRRAAKKYPVIENIYAGPQGSFVPKSFAAYNAMQAIAELGFIVVQIDGMGTSNRSKAFHDVAWQNLGDAGLSRSHPLAQGGRGEVSVLRHHPRRDLRHVGGRAERARRAALPRRLLQGGRVGVRLPRQPDGQDLVERAVDGMAARPALRGSLQRGPRQEPDAAICC